MLRRTERIPILRGDDGELIGYVSQEASSWAAMTTFGYVMARAESEEAAASVVKTEGPRYIDGVWRYYDKSDKDWFSCTIKEAYEHKVVVRRTNDLGYEDPATYRLVTLQDPDESSLQKA